MRVGLVGWGYLRYRTDGFFYRAREFPTMTRPGGKGRQVGGVMACACVCSSQRSW